ncbi:MAG: ABC transporter ATP-binding protein [Candidatus Fermentithermobacillus carboniphilus]|uniref:ABC transporter ATP-binding protein n=1 Tax=Candidatus Fermentithermobacillus carboniphilus TaxID=3085328 RepID=A0AAT9LCE3_9FIRM|nr:MAG: ABC transporter ATP-binding protein [Candidatus Fermentithermobacillus carboniphilus]
MLRLAKLLKPFAASIVLAMLLVLAQAVADLALPTLMADIVDKGIVRGDTALILRTGARMLLVALGGSTAAVLAAFLSARVSAGFGKLLRNMVFEHVESFSLQDFDKFGTASLVTRTTNDITQVQVAVFSTMRIFAMAPMMCIGGVVMAVSEQPKLSMTLISALPFLGLVVLFGAKVALPLFKSLQLKLDKLNLILRENLTGIRVIRAFNRTDHELRRFDAANLDLTGTALKVNRLMAGLSPLVMLILNGTMIVIMWTGAHYIDAGIMEVGSLMAFIQYAMQILMSLLMVSMLFVLLPRASASADRIVEVLDTRPTVVDAERSIATNVGASKVRQGEIEFRNVTFRYPGAERPALKNISFVARPGQVTAIIGGTGSGKSTLVSLIPRFYDPEGGQILIDGIDIRQYPLDELRAMIGFVPQKAVLFSGTVSENIRYGKPDATDEEVRTAAKIAQAEQFVDEMSNGFDSLISQGGTNLSGGQKQRLAIARAIVRRPKIYVFDDSFSALDFKTDAKLRAALKDVTAQSTVIIVAQRVSTVMDADQIIVLDEGEIAGIGTHRELMKTCQAYREIVSSQLSEEEIA